MLVCYDLRLFYVILHIALQPVGQFRQGLTTMRNLVLLRLVHLRVSSPLVLECRIPSYANVSVSVTLIGSLRY